MRWISAALATAVFALDWASKAWAQARLPGGRIELVEGFLRLSYVENQGIAFGLFHASESDWKPILLSAAALAALAIVGYYIASTPPGERALFVAFGLLLGGIAGNFLDRILSGYVVDFIEMHWRDAYHWPTYNVADAAITCGVAIVLAHSLFAPQPSQEESSSQGASAGSKAALWLLPAAFLALAQPVEAGQSEARQLVQELQENYDGIRAFTADFRQMVNERGLIHEESGELAMKKPGLMHWEYSKPEEKHFVADGKKSYFYDVGQNQVIVSEMELESVDTPLLFLLGKGRLLDDFEVALEEEEPPLEESNRMVLLMPKRPRESFDYLLLEIDPESKLIRRLVVVEPLGTRRDYILDNIQLNPEIPGKRFRFKIPKKAEVIER